MKPTLNNYIDGYVDYGSADCSSGAIKSLQRFDVVLTNYPNDWSMTDNSLKIKRIWGFPGETLSLQNGKFEVYKNNSLVFSISASLGNNMQTYPLVQKTFKVMFEEDRVINQYALKDNEYFVMGDNWTSSYDSYTANIEEKKENKINFQDLKGHVVSLDGKGQVENNKLINKIPYHSRYFF